MSIWRLVAAYFNALSGEAPNLPGRHFPPRPPEGAALTKGDPYSFVMHLVSRVVGTLRQDLDVLHAYQACMNMGTALSLRCVPTIKNWRNT